MLLTSQGPASVCEVFTAYTSIDARFLLPSTRGVLESEPGDVEVA